MSASSAAVTHCVCCEAGAGAGRQRMDRRRLTTNIHSI